MGKKAAKAGLLSAHWRVREKGPWRRVQGVSQGGAAAAHCFLGWKSDPLEFRRCTPVGKKRGSERHWSAPRRESAWTRFQFSCVCLEVGLLGHMITLGFTSRGNAKLFSITATPF